MRPALLPLLAAACLATGSCTSLTLEPHSEHGGVVVGESWSINFLTITLPLNPRERALDVVANATLPDVRNAQVTEWPDFFWPFNWLNGLVGFCAAEVRADYGLPPPVDRFPVAPATRAEEAGGEGAREPAREDPAPPETEGGGR